MTNNQLAQTFPEAAPILKRLIRADRAAITLHNDNMNRIKSYLSLGKKPFGLGPDQVDLIELLIGGNLYVTTGGRCGASSYYDELGFEIKTPFQQLWSRRERLAKNEYILRLIEQPQHPNKLRWDERVIEAKNKPITDYLKINTQGFALCPIRQEKTPSFKYYKKTNSWYCYGCQKGGDIIELIILWNNLSFKEAVKFLTS